ncbi:MAG: DUF6754 domain-containing protein [Candidatus Bathyarchaeia archaeon]
MLIQGRITLFVIFIIYTVVMSIFVELGRRGRTFPLRKIPAIEAIDEGVSRAVEMGRPVHWTEGHPRASKLYDAYGVYLVASLAFLTRAAQLCAEKGARLLTSVGHPELYPIAREIVSQAYIYSGKKEEYVEGDIMLMPEYSYLAAILGRIIRERPATHIQVGYFWGQDSVAIPEVARGEGCFSVTGGQVYALPFLVVLSDYTLLADEVFAASAQITHDPILIMNMVGLDVNKMIIIIILVVGIILSSLGISTLSNLIWV